MLARRHRTGQLVTVLGDEAQGIGERLQRGRRIQTALNRLLAMRSYMRSIHVDGKPDLGPLLRAGIDDNIAKEMYRYLAIANYEDRFVVPTAHEEIRLDDYHAFQGQNGFTFGADQSKGPGTFSLFPERRTTSPEPRTPAPVAEPRD